MRSLGAFVFAALSNVIIGIAAGNLMAEGVIHHDRYPLLMGITVTVGLLLSFVGRA